MNFQKWTEKSIEAIQAAQNLARENANSQIEQEHLLLALLTQENGLIPEIITGLKCDEKMLLHELTNKRR